METTHIKLATRINGTYSFTDPSDEDKEITGEFHAEEWDTAAPDEDMELLIWVPGQDGNVGTIALNRYELQGALNDTSETVAVPTDNWEQYESVKEYADSVGLTIDQAIRVLVNLGLKKT